MARRVTAVVSRVGTTEQRPFPVGQKSTSEVFSTCTIEICLELTEPETPADFLQRGSAIRFPQFSRVEILSDLDFAFDHAIIARVVTEKGGSD